MTEKRYLTENLINKFSNEEHYLWKRTQSARVNRKERSALRT